MTECPHILSKSYFWAIKCNFRRSYSNNCLPPVSILINESKWDPVKASLRIASPTQSETSSEDRPSSPLIMGRKDRICPSPLPSGIFSLFSSPLILPYLKLLLVPAASRFKTKLLPLQEKSSHCFTCFNLHVLSRKHSFDGLTLKVHTFSHQQRFGLIKIKPNLCALLRTSVDLFSSSTYPPPQQCFIVIYCFKIDNLLGKQ